MPNEQTSVPLFASGEVLTASNLNLSAGTGVPVFATTITRDAAFGGASEKVLAEGQLCYLSSTNVVQYYDGAAWATVGPATAGGLTLITAQTIGTTVSSVTVTGAFSSTYDNYKIIISGGVGSANMNLLLTLGATAAGYYWVNHETTYSGGADGSSTGNNTSSWRAGGANTNTIYQNIEIMSPNLAKNTTFQGGFGGNNSLVTAVSSMAGILNDSTQYTAFTLTTSTGTITGGTIRVFGYLNS
jgi:hypothetical protein